MAASSAQPTNVPVDWDSVLQQVQRFATHPQQLPAETKTLDDSVAAILWSLLTPNEVDLAPSHHAPVGLRIQRHATHPTSGSLPPLQRVRDIGNLPGQSGCLAVRTSGTTGQATTVHHSLATLTHAVRKNRPDDRWGLTYHPLSYAGLQVILQAAANENELIPLIGIPWQQAADRINEFGVTHLSGTPTFFQMLLAAGQRFDSIRRVITGGEPLRPELLTAIEQSFPHATVRNIYASTELGTIMESENEQFRVPNEHAHRFRVLEGELHVRPDPASSSLELPADFYATGDTVEVIDSSPLTFRIVGRRGTTINVAGHKVDPETIERALEALPEVVAAEVWGEPNPVTSQVVACNIVPANEALPIDTIALRNQLAQDLERHEVPRLIHVVDRIEVTPSGKKFWRQR